MDKLLYRDLLKLACKTTKKVEDAEDVTQTVALRLLSIPKDSLDRPDSYAKTAVFNESLDLMRGRKRWERASKEETEALSTEDRHTDYYAREVLLQALSLLPKRRREVMTQVLAGNKIAEIPGDYNTNKHHYLLGIRQLKEYFKIKESRAVKALDHMRRRNAG